MDMFAPEFAQYWLPGQSTNSGDPKPAHHDDETAAQQAALEALAERISAARSIY